MASANVLELTDDNFEKEVLKSDIPTLVDFWAVWCGPCRQVAPTVDALADEFSGKLKVGKMDIDHHKITPQQFQIRSIPTLMIFREKIIIFSQPGALPASAFKQLVDRANELDMDEVRKQIAEEQQKNA